MRRSDGIETADKVVRRSTFYGNLINKYQYVAILVALLSEFQLALFSVPPCSLAMFHSYNPKEVHKIF